MLKNTKENDKVNNCNLKLDLYITLEINKLTLLMSFLCVYYSLYCIVLYGDVSYKDSEACYINILDQHVKRRI